MPIFMLSIFFGYNWCHQYHLPAEDYVGFNAMYTIIFRKSFFRAHFLKKCIKSITTTHIWADSITYFKTLLLLPEIYWNSFIIFLWNLSSLMSIIMHNGQEMVIFRVKKLFTYILFKLWIPSSLSWSSHCSSTFKYNLSSAKTCQSSKHKLIISSQKMVSSLVIIVNSYGICWVHSIKNPLWRTCSRSSRGQWLW